MIFFLHTEKHLMNFREMLCRKSSACVHPEAFCNIGNDVSYIIKKDDRPLVLQTAVPVQKAL